MWEVFVVCDNRHTQKAVDPLTDVDGNIVVKLPGECRYCIVQPQERELTWREKRAVAKAIKKLERL